MAIGSALSAIFQSYSAAWAWGGWLVELGTGPFISRGQRSNLQWEIYGLYGPYTAM